MYTRVNDPNIALKSEVQASQKPIPVVWNLRNCGRMFSKCSKIPMILFWNFPSFKEIEAGFGETETF